MNSRRRRRLSRLGIEVGAILLRDPARTFYGLELVRELKVQSGSLYPMLTGWEERGWLVGYDEQIDPAEEGRPPRRYLRLTASGLAAVRAEVHAVRDLLAAV